MYDVTKMKSFYQQHSKLTVLQGHNSNPQKWNPWEEKLFLKPIFYFFLHTRTRPNAIIPRCRPATWGPNCDDETQLWWAGFCATHRERELHNPKTPSHVVSDTKCGGESWANDAALLVCFGHVLFCFTRLRNTMPKLSEIQRAVELQVLQVCGTQGIKSPKLCWIDWLFSSSSLSIKCL